MPGLAIIGRIVYGIYIMREKADFSILERATLETDRLDYEPRGICFRKPMVMEFQAQEVRYAIFPRLCLAASVSRQLLAESQS